jgi:ribosomal protein L16 Arg81 hydroxylase
MYSDIGATAHPEIGNDRPMCFEWENFIQEYWKKHPKWFGNIFKNSLLASL